MRPFGGNWGQAQAPALPVNVQQVATLGHFRPPPVACGGAPHLHGSGLHVPQPRPQNPLSSAQSVGPTVPAEFQQNLQFLDARCVSGLPLTRWVKFTDWSYKKQIVGCPVHAIPLQAVLYKSFQSYWLRHIAEGRLTYWAGFKSMSKVVFCHALVAQLREEGLDLGGLAASVLQQTGQNPLQTDRVTATRKLAKKIASFIVSC